MLQLAWSNKRCTKCKKPAFPWRTTCLPCGHHTLQVLPVDEPADKIAASYRLQHGPSPYVMVDGALILIEKEAK